MKQTLIISLQVILIALISTSITLQTALAQIDFEISDSTVICICNDNGTFTDTIVIRGPHNMLVRGVGDPCPDGIGCLFTLIDVETYQYILEEHDGSAYTIEVETSPTNTIDWQPTDLSFSNMCEVPNIQILLDSIINPLCFGDTNGEIYISVTGGTPPYAYDWNNDGTGENDDPEDLIGLPTGMYNLTVTDSKQFQGTFTVTLIYPPPLMLSLAPTHPICGSSGSIMAMASEGTPPYTYTLSTGATSSNGMFSNLLPGTYTVTVIDNNGCNTASSVNLVAQNSFPTAINLNPAKVCTGQSANLTAKPGGGTPPYTFLWNTGMMTQTMTTPPLATPTTFSVTVTDADACQSTASIIVPVNNLKVNINIIETVCMGDTTILTATGIHGCPPYSYLWNTGSTTQTITPVTDTITTYSVTVTDNDGCMATASALACIDDVFAAEPVIQLIVKIPEGETADNIADCLDGEVIQRCNCDTLALIAFPDSTFRDNDCFFFDIEEKKKGAMQTLEAESDVNYVFDYCPQDTEGCIDPNDTELTSPFVIGLVDSGIQTSSTTFNNSYQTTILGCGDAGNIVVNSQLLGFNFSDTSDTSITDDLGHGTHLSNILYQNENEGVSIFNTKVISGTNNGTSSLFNAICGLHALSNYNQEAISDPSMPLVKVINFSLGYYGLENKLLSEAIKKAGDNDIIVVCSAGNGGANMDETSKIIVCNDTICLPDTSNTALISEVNITNTISNSCTQIIDSVVIDTLQLGTIPATYLLDTLDIDIVIDSILVALDSICVTITDTLYLNHYPSEDTLDNIISVTALDNSNPDIYLAENANTGVISVDMAAPGVGVVSYALDDNDELIMKAKSGTSQAAALVTRYIARLRAEHPDSNYLAIRQMLQNSVVGIKPLDSIIAWGGTLNIPFEPLGVCADIPIELIDFQVSPTSEQAAIYIDWQTGVEEDFKGFELQVSFNAVNFSPLHWENSRGHDSRYNFLHRSIQYNRVYYYRLKIIDNDGSYTYSSVESAVLKKENHFDIYPNPSNRGVILGIESPHNGMYNIRFYSIEGKIILNKTVNVQTGYNDLYFPVSQLSDGMYIIEVGNGKTPLRQKFIKY